MKQRPRLVSLAIALTMLAAAAPSFALEVRDPDTHLGFVVPDTWLLASDAPWTQVDAPDHKFRVRIAPHTRGALTDREAESAMLNLLGAKWATYTVDQHARRVSFAGFSGVDIVGHGAGDSWDRAKFHMFLLVDQGAPQRGAVIWLSGSQDTWDGYHTIVEHAVKLLRAG